MLVPSVNQLTVGDRHPHHAYSQTPVSPQPAKPVYDSSVADAFFPLIYPLRFHLETLAAFHVPEYKGSLFRGGFGYFFRDLVCVTRAPACPGCPHLHTCSYSTVFESPVAPERIGVLRKYPNAPHPFVMAPPLDSRTLLPAGTDLSLDITLIGEGVKTLPHFLVVFEEMGRSGRFGGKFRLRAVHSALPAAQPVFDGVTRRIAESVPPWIASPEPPPPQRAHLSFLTPLRMRTGGVPVPSTLSAINRGLFITGWGWFFGLALFLAFTGIYKWVDDAKGIEVRDAYWALLPSLGSAVGVIVQEIWEEKPLSEPL